MSYKLSKTNWAGTEGVPGNQSSAESPIVPIEGRDTLELEPGTYYLAVARGPGLPGYYRLRLKTAPASHPVSLDGTSTSAEVAAGGWQWFHFVMPDPPPPGLTFAGTEGLDWMLRDTLRPSKINFTTFNFGYPVDIGSDDKNSSFQYHSGITSQHIDTRATLRPGATYYFGVTNHGNTPRTADISLAADPGTINVPALNFLNGTSSGTLNPGEEQEMRINAPADAQRLKLMIQGGAGITAKLEQGSPASAGNSFSYWKQTLVDNTPVVLEQDLNVNQAWPWRAGVSYWVKLANTGSQPVAVTLQSTGKSPANSDDDHDGMLDGWELTHFGTMVRDGTLDYDFDGVSDLREFLDQTDPTNFSSYRCRVVLTIVGDGTVTFSPEAESYPKGTPLEASVSPLAGATFIKWLSNTSEGNGEVEVNLSGIGLVLNRPYTFLKAFFTSSALAQAVDQPSGLWWTGEGYSTFGGNTPPWISQTELTHDGQDAARSGAPPLGRGTGISTRVQGPGRLNFQWRVGQPGSFSAFGRILMDGSQVKSRFGYQDWTADFMEIAEGTHTVTWEAFGAGFPQPGATPNYVWLDEVSFIPAPPDSDHDGLPDPWELQWFGTLGYQGWNDADGDGNDNATELADGTIPTSASSLRPRLFLTSPGGSVSVDPFQLSYDYGQTVTITASGTGFSHFEGDLVTSTNPLPLTLTRNLHLQAIFDPGLDAALDQYSGWTSVLSPGGHGWKGRVDFTGPTDGDVAATQPGQLPASQPDLARTFTGPLTLSFWWKVDQGQTFLEHEDAVLFATLDGEKIATCTSGSIWSMASLYIPAGDHVLAFSFKTSATGNGKERAWLDQVQPYAPTGGALALQLALAAAGVPPDKSHPYADADGDGTSNLMEWALGSNPADSSSQTSLPPAHLDNNQLCLTLPLPPDHDLSGIHFDFQTSRDLKTWTSLGVIVTKVGNTLEVCVPQGTDIGEGFLILLVSLENPP